MSEAGQRPALKSGGVYDARFVGLADGRERSRRIEVVEVVPFIPGMVEVLHREVVGRSKGLVVSAFVPTADGPPKAHGLVEWTLVPKEKI